MTIKTKEESETNEIVKIDDSILFENESEKVKQIKVIIEKRKDKIKEYELFVEQYKDEISFKDELQKNKLKTKITRQTKHPFVERRPRRLGSLINGQIVEVIGFTTGFTYLITNLGVFENNIENLRKYMNDYLTKEEIKHPSFSCYFCILSQFKIPIFTLQKCERSSFVIISKIDIKVLTAFNYLFFSVIKERENFEEIDERIEKEISYLTLNKLYLIEDVFEEFDDLHDRKIKLLLTDKKNIFTVMLPKRFNTLSEEHEQLFKSTRGPRAWCSADRSRQGKKPEFTCTKYPVHGYA
jgi:hypothetical protein